MSLETGLALAAVAVSVVLLVGLWVLAARWWARLRRVRIQHIAQRAERDAVGLLTAAGFVVEGEQVTAEWPVLVDGRQLPLVLRADFIVSRRGRRYVADVKSGQLVATLRSAATRRQLLEYSLAYDVDGALLVDMTRRQIVEVAFPGI